MVGDDTIHRAQDCLSRCRRRALFPNWTRIEAALARQDVHVTADELSRAEPRARKQLDDERTIGTTTDASRGWLFFDLILEHAGVPRSPQTSAALVELHAYHQANNLWELVPDGVRPALLALRAHGLTLVVVSNANGTLRAHMDRIGLSTYVDIVIDSRDEGVEKPDPRLFQIALERAGARPESTIHVGDLYQVDVVGARAAGLRRGAARRDESASRCRLRPRRLTWRAGRSRQERWVRLRPIEGLRRHRTPIHALCAPAARFDCAHHAPSPSKGAGASRSLAALARSSCAAVHGASSLLRGARSCRLLGRNHLTCSDAGDAAQPIYRLRPMPNWSPVAVGLPSAKTISTIFSLRAACRPRPRAW